MRQSPVPIPDDAAVADAYDICDTHTDAWDDAYDAAYFYASGYGHTHAEYWAGGFADAWTYAHTHTDLLPATDHDRNPDPATVADAVARTICNTPGNAGTDPETLAGIYSDTWAAAYRAASDRQQHGPDRRSSTGTGGDRPGTERTQ